METVNEALTRAEYLSLLREIIRAVGIIIAAAIPSTIAYLVTRKWFSKSKYLGLLKQHRIAISDIQYLLSVEKFHCRKHIEDTGHSNRNIIRLEVETETKEQWSGHYSSKRGFKKLQSVNEEIKRLEQR